MQVSSSKARIPEVVIPGLSRDPAARLSRLGKFIMRFARRIPAQGRDDSQCVRLSIASFTKPARAATPLVALVLLCSCILVDDFSPQWEKAKPDSCITKIAEPIYYSDFRRDPAGKDLSTLAHVFTLGKFHFLMLKQDASDAGGRMYRFGIINGIFQRYRLDPVMRSAFEIEFPNAPVSLKNDTVTLAKLGKEEMKLLTEISSREDYWEIEDQALYNPILNPLCRFDDRDLDALSGKSKAKAKK